MSQVRLAAKMKPPKSDILKQDQRKITKFQNDWDATGFLREIVIIVRDLYKIQKFILTKFGEPQNRALGLIYLNTAAACFLYQRLIVEASWTGIIEEKYWQQRTEYVVPENKRNVVQHRTSKDNGDFVVFEEDYRQAGISLNPSKIPLSLGEEEMSKALIQLADILAETGYVLIFHIEKHFSINVWEEPPPMSIANIRDKHIVARGKMKMLVRYIGDYNKLFDKRKVLSVPREDADRYYFYKWLQRYNYFDPKDSKNATASVIDSRTNVKSGRVLNPKLVGDAIVRQGRF